MTIFDRILGSRPKSISIFRTSFPKFLKIIFMLCIIPLKIRIFRDFYDSEVRHSKKNYSIIDYF